MHPPLHPPRSASALASPPPGERTHAADVDRARLRSEVAARLGPVCATMAPEHFARLVDDVAAFTLRWSQDPAVHDY